MKTRRADVSRRGPSLPDALEEIVAKLINDNWCKISTRDGLQAYYIVGCDEQAADLDGRVEFPDWAFPIPTESGPLSEAAVRSQVADEHCDYLKRSRRDLEKAGLSPAAIGSLISGDSESPNCTWHQDVPTVERLRLLWNLHQAVRVAHFDARPIELDSDETAEANVAREKMCLKEVSKKYLKIVARWEQLDRLSFEDPQLQEASKTYLYGFYRACIVLCAIAVENQLKRICGSDRPIRELIKSAKECKYITLDLADAAQRLFGIRNDVVHNNDDPLADKAKEMVGVARLLVSEFRNVPSFSK